SSQYSQHFMNKHTCCYFYIYRVHRDLPSFPTRRSSDLPEPGRRSGGSWHAGAGRRDGRTCSPPEGDSTWPGVRRQLQISHLAAGDRKSTRLNSSHVKISYAVFCLKKKKKKIKILI